MLSKEDYNKASMDDYFKYEMYLKDQEQMDYIIKNDVHTHDLVEVGRKIIVKAAKSWHVENEDLNMTPLKNISGWLRSVYKRPRTSVDPVFYRTPHEVQEYIEKITAIPGVGNVEKIRLSFQTSGSSGSHPFLGTWPLGLRIGVNIKEADARPAMLVFGGIHGDEFITSVAVLNFIDFVLGELQDAGTELYSLLEKSELIIVPLLNPDGLEYSIQTEKPHRKNTNTRTNKFPEHRLGVDPNRNFPIYFGYDRSSHDEGFNHYSGPYPFSEAETSNIDELMKEHNIVLAVDCHSGKQRKVYHPSSGSRIKAKFRSKTRNTQNIGLDARSESLYATIRDEVKHSLASVATSGTYTGYSGDVNSGTSDEFLYHVWRILAFTVEITEEDDPDITREFIDDDLNLFNNLLISLLRSINKFGLQRH